MRSWKRRKRRKWRESRALTQPETVCHASQISYTTSFDAVCRDIGVFLLHPRLYMYSRHCNCSSQRTSELNLVPRFFASVSQERSRYQLEMMFSVSFLQTPLLTLLLYINSNEFWLLLVCHLYCICHAVLVAIQFYFESPRARALFCTFTIFRTSSLTSWSRTYVDRARL